MSVIRPIADDATDTTTARVGNNAAPAFPCLDNYDDTKSISASGTTARRTAVDLSGSFPFTGDPTTLRLNIRVKITGTMAAGSFLQFTVWCDDATHFSRPANFALDTGVGTDYADFSLPGGTFSASGSNTGPELWITFIGGSGNTGRVDLAHASWGTVEVSSTDYPQAGGASVTMSGSSTKVRNAATPALGASVTMSGHMQPGTDLSFPGAPPVLKKGTNSYFFLPPGATVGIIDDGNPFQGQGLRPLK